MLQKIKNNRPQAGFTLVELLIVIVIIAILAAIAISAFAGAQAEARDSQRVADMDQVKTQLELYYAENGSYPASADLQGALDTVGGSNGLLEGLGTEALTDPSDNDGGNSFGDTATPAAGVYGYIATVSDSDTTTACTTAADDCKSFTLYYFSEQNGAVVDIKDVSGE